MSGPASSDAHTIPPPPGSTQFLLSTPAPVLHLLARSSPFLRICTELTRAISWKHKNAWASWLLLGMWWLVCLLGDRLAKYGVNLVLVGILALGALMSGHVEDQPVGEDQELSPQRLQAVLEDARQLASALHELSSQFLWPLRDIWLWRNRRRSMLVLSYVVTSYPAYIIISYYFGVRYIFLVSGTILFSWHAPWSAHCRRGLWQSLTIRSHLSTVGSLALGGGQDTLTYLDRSNKIRALIVRDLHTVDPVVIRSESGFSLPPEDPKAARTALGATINDGSNVIFTFTVFENQRWWVGLDWTQALLPSERPPWCDHSLHAVSPPSSFTLPSPQIVSTPKPTRKNPDAYTKRISQWQWVDSDWHVRPDSHSGIPIEASSAATADLSATAASAVANTVLPVQQAGETTSPAKGFAAAAQLTDWARSKAIQASQSARRGTEVTTASKVHGRKGSWMPFSDDEPPVSPTTATPDAASLPGTSLSPDPDQEWVADSQGWQYFDNAWEKLSAKGGIGKYTRRRAWQRRARIHDIVQEVSEPSSDLRKRITADAEIHD